jgi:putative glutamine amidotransferase
LIATWIRDVDEAHFQRVFAAFPTVRLWNARAAEGVLPWDDVCGLLLTGGSDISAEFLKQPIPDPALIHEPDATRDAWEFDALQRVLPRRLPILAICRGHQVLNVELGGTLLLDIPGHDDPATKFGNLQELRYENGASVQFAQVNSSHHQAVDRPGAGLQIEARHAGDGIVEQIRLSDYPYAQGVQYHPERDPLYAPLFEEFVRQVGAAAVIRIRFFAQSRQAVGTETYALPAEKALTQEEVWSRLEAAFPLLTPWRKVSRLAREEVYLGSADTIRPGDEIAIIPPVSGG